MRVVVIGLGGIGSNLMVPLATLYSHMEVSDGERNLIVIDGDKYEPKNRARQVFQVEANKAEDTAERLRDIFPDITIEAKPRFVDESSIYLFVKERDIVFLAVDNHATRALVADHIKTLDNAILISGGNEDEDGDILIYERRDGKDVRPHFSLYHPEIFKGGDRNPSGMSCEELAAIPSSHQLLAVNLKVAAYMVDALTFLAKKREIPYDELYFSWATGNARAVKRPPLK